MGLTACSGTPNDPAPVVDTRFGTTSEALSGNDAVARGALWVAAEVPYCQSPNGQPDPDTSCSSVCMRPSNPEWDPYRSDCSGFVSWAWDLPAPGRTTSEFAPAETDITSVIDGSQLLPGDALNVPGDHIILFVSWVVAGQSANFYEEPGCSANPPYAHAFTSNVEISGSSVTVDYESNTFTAIRYTALAGTVADGGIPTLPDAGAPTESDSGAGTPCSVNGVDGECMLTTTCSTMQGVSTPGYCPGADDIQCCTGAVAPSDDAGMPHEADSGTTPPPSGTDSGTATLTEDSGAGNTGSGSGAKPADGGTVTGGSGSNGYGGGKPEPGDDAPTGTHGSKGCSSSPSGPQDGLWLLGLACLLLRKRRAIRSETA
jgi:hypothetical protein